MEFQGPILFLLFRPKIPILFLFFYPKIPIFLFFERHLSLDALCLITKFINICEEKQ